MFPVEKEVLNAILRELCIPDIGSATIRQICSVAAELEKSAGEKCVHLEIGNPGLPAEQIGVQCECEALKKGVANQYPDIKGVPELKSAGSKFIKAFMNLEIPEKGVVPTVGSMQGSFTLMLLLKQRIETRIRCFCSIQDFRHSAIRPNCWVFARKHLIYILIEGRLWRLNWRKK